MLCYVVVCYCFDVMVNCVALCGMMVFLPRSVHCMIWDWIGSDFVGLDCIVV